MPEGSLSRLIARLDAAVPRLQREFLLHGPLRNSFPADIRSDLVRVFTQVLTRAIDGGSAEELTTFIEAVIWEARKAGVQPAAFRGWIDRYEAVVETLLDPTDRAQLAPYLQVVRDSAARLQN